MPDRIEAGTFMIAAAITGGDVKIRGMKPEHLDALVFKLQDAGVEITSRDNVVRVKAPKKLRSVNIKTRPYPGFPTDMQAQFMALMCVADGASVISENIFENRFMHVSELLRFGADITVEGNSATVKGVKEALRRAGHGHRPAGLGIADPGRPGRGQHHRDLPHLPPGPGV